jgi:hypothetical protein
MKKLLLTVFLVVPVIYCCYCARSDKATSLESIDVVTGLSVMRQINLSDFAKEIDYYPLAAEKTHSLRSIVLFVSSGQYILISDLLGCYLYDREGNFISSIGKRGRGPGEYEYISQISIDTNGISYIRNQRRIYEFNANGDLIREYDIMLPESPTSTFGNWLYLKNGTFLVQICNDSGTEENKAVIISKYGDVISQFKNHITFLKERQGSSSLAEISSIYFLNDSIVRYKELFNDTLFTLSEGQKLIPYMRFELGRFKTNYLDHSNQITGRVKLDREWVRIYDLFETESCILFFLQATLDLLKRPEPYFEDGYYKAYYTNHLLGIYDKATRETVISEVSKTNERLQQTGLFNDIDGDPKFFPRFRMGDGRLAMPIEAYELKRYIESDSFKKASSLRPEKKKALEDLVNSLSVDDNPVLMVVGMK